MAVPSRNGNPVPWDSPGKNPGVDCHFLLQCRKVKSESEDAQSWTAAYQAPPSMGFSRQAHLQLHVTLVCEEGSIVLIERRGSSLPHTHTHP